MLRDLVCSGRSYSLQALYSATMEQRRFHSAVLAAGKSTRFGGTKQLARLHGESLVRRAVATAEQLTGPSSLLVLGHDWQAVLEASLPLQGFFIRNERYAAGIATSIAAAATAVEGISDALLLLLADQPLVTADHLAALRSAWLDNRSSIVVSRYDGVSGPPVVFPARMFETLRRLEGDRGARALIDSADENVVRIDCALASVDIDTPDALQKIS